MLYFGALFQWHVGHNSTEPRILVGHFLHESSLLDMQSRINRNFSKHQLVDVDLGPRLIEIFQKVSAVDFRHTREPAIVKALYVIEVDVTIDDWKIGHVSFPDVALKGAVESGLSSIPQYCLPP